MSNSDFAREGVVHPITELMRELIKAGDEYSRSLGKSLDVNPTDFKVMQHLMENGPQTPTQLAQAIGVTSGALTQSLDRLEKLNHAIRTRSDSDRRSVLVVANQESVKRAWQGISPLIAKSEELVSQMDPADQLAIQKFISEMIDAYSASIGPSHSS